MADNPQNTWDEYYERVRSRRIAEAEAIWRQMRLAGVSDDTVLALDFTHFSSDKIGADSLSKQLRENYEISITKADEPNYSCIKGTTRPYGITMNELEHMQWVEFMCDVAQSHGCVFSTWTLEDHAKKQSWSNETVETEYD